MGLLLLLAAIAPGSAARAEPERPLASADLSPGSRIGLETLLGFVPDDVLVPVLLPELVLEPQVSRWAHLSVRLPIVAFPPGLGNVAVGGRVVTRGDAAALGLGGGAALGVGTRWGALGEVFHGAHDPGRYMPRASSVRLEADVAAFGEKGSVQAQVGFRRIVIRDATDDHTSFAGGTILRLGLAGATAVNTRWTLLGEWSAIVWDALDASTATEHALDFGMRRRGARGTLTFRAVIASPSADMRLGFGIDWLRRY